MLVGFYNLNLITKTGSEITKVSDKDQNYDLKKYQDLPRHGIWLLRTNK